MSTKKIIFITALFLLGVGLTISGAVLMVAENTGKKISSEKFKEIIIKDSCSISDEQTTAIGNIKTQIISMDYGCPYNISYVEFRNKDYQKDYVASSINKINYNNGDITTRINISIFDYQETRTTGSAYNVLISKDNTVVIASSTNKNKDKLDKIIDELGISSKITWNRAWMILLGIILIGISITLVIVSLKENNTKEMIKTKN